MDGSPKADNKANIKRDAPDVKSDVSEIVTVVVRSQQASELAFNAKMHMPFSKIANAWCKNQGIDPKTVRFHSEEGERIDKNKRIDELGLDAEEDPEDGNKSKIFINAFMEQVGGWRY